MSVEASIAKSIAASTNALFNGLALCDIAVAGGINDDGGGCGNNNGA